MKNSFQMMPNFDDLDSYIDSESDSEESEEPLPQKKPKSHHKVTTKFYVYTRHGFITLVQSSAVKVLCVNFV